MREISETCVSVMQHQLLHGGCHLTIGVVQPLPKRPLIGEAEDDMCVGV